MRNVFKKTDILFCTAGIIAIIILATSSAPSLIAGALITLILLASRYVTVYTFIALALLLLPYLIVSFPATVPAAICLFITVAALKGCSLLFKHYDIFSVPIIALKEVHMYGEEAYKALKMAFKSVNSAFNDGRALDLFKHNILLPSEDMYTALKVALISVNSAFNDGRALDLFKRDILLPLKSVLNDNRALNLVKHNILLPSEDMYTALKVALISVKNAFSDGRALDLFKREILSPLESVPTALTNTAWSLVESLRQQVKVSAKILL